MISIITGVMGFLAGLFLGVTFKTIAFESQEWRVMRWNKDTLGYRPCSPGVKLFRGDKVTMSLDLDSSKFPEEGVRVE